ncbi:unnamed protein product [Chrysoparadoxa australica]
MAKTAAACLNHPSFKGHCVPNPSTERGNNVHIGAHPKDPILLYPSGKYIIARNLEDPSQSFVYRGHNAVTTVAKFSPNGFWVASADATGKVRVWAWDNPEHNLKIEIFGIGGAIKDLAWDGESKRIVVVGDGTSQNMRAFAWDTGSALGEVVGHNKRVVSCDYRSERPFKIMTGSEDMRTIFFKGPPFSLDHSNKDQHSNFINCVRFSPDCSKVVTVGSDKKIWIYDGKTGEPMHSLPESHTGGIYSVAWSADSHKIVTASADKTCKLWDVTSAPGYLITTWTLGAEVADMQCGVVWMRGQILSLSLSGDLNELKEGAAEPVKVIQAHQVAVTAMCPTPTASGEFITGSFDGVVCRCDAGTGTTKRITGQVDGSICRAAHSNKVTSIGLAKDGIVSVGWDDSLRVASLSTGAYTAVVPLEGQPCSVSCSPSSDLAAVATTKGVVLSRGATIVKTLETTYTPASVALLGEEEVAVGADDNKIYIYALSGADLTQTQVIEGHRGKVTALAYSPDQLYLAAGDAAKEVNVWTRGSWDAKVQGLWQFHTTQITCIAWCPDSQLVATGAMDENIYIWSLAKTRRRINYPFSHKEGVVGLAWSNPGELVSAGADHCIAKWDILEDRTVFTKK